MGQDRTLLKWAVFAVVMALVPMGLHDKPYLMHVIVLAILFATMGQAWNIVGGLANQISLGHAAFFGIGCYASTLLLIKFGLSPWVGLLVAVLVSGAAGALLCIPTMRLRGHYFALATLAFGEVMRAIANSWSGLTGGPVGLSVPVSNDSFVLLQFESPVPYFYIFLAAFLLTTALFIAISRSKLGYRLRAVKANPDAAEVIGVNTARTKVIASVISAGLMGACGTLFAQFTFFFDPNSVFSLGGISIKVALICIIGGIGTAVGPLIGAFFILPLEEIFSGLFMGQSGGYSQLAYGVILIIVILVEPRGIVALVKALRRRLFGPKPVHGTRTLQGGK